MKAITILITACIWSLNVFATDYHFVAQTDHQYVNPANWTPSYPGIEVQAGDRVFIESDAVFEGLDLEINGSLEVALGATLSSTTGEVRLRPSSVCNNYGTIRVKGARVWGSLMNNTSARMMTNFLAIRESASTSNLPGASLMISGDLANLGRFLNYGHVSVGNNLILMQESAFYQIGRAELLVRGGLSADPSSMFDKAPQSYFQIARANR